MRRYAAIAPSRGTQIPATMRLLVLDRDRGCVGPSVGMPGDCYGTLELDHVRASHGIGMKSRTAPDNLVTLCGGHHRTKTEAGRTWRPVLLDYLSRIEDPHAAHVDPCGPTCRKEVAP